MGSTVDDVHKRYRQDVWFLSLGQIRNVLVERNTLMEDTAVSRRACDDQNTFTRTFSAAAALATAKLTPRMALAPRLVLFFVPSSLRRKSSTLAWSLTSKSCFISSGPMVSLTFLTAFRTPFPPHFDLSPSRSSQASAAPSRWCQNAVV